MRISDTELIERYLEGELGTEETAQLRHRIDAAPGVLDALVMGAYELESLREALSGDIAATATPVSDSRPIRRRLLFAVAAAVAVIASTGWVVAWMGHRSMIEVQQELASLRSQISQGQVDTSQAEPSTATNAARPLTISRRGLLLALADRGHPAHSIAIGHEVPLERRLWTCPWGAAEFRFSDGLAIALDRSTVATLGEDSDSRVVHLEAGLLHVTNWPPRQDSGITVVRTPHARVRLTDAEVTVDVRDGRTIVEAAEGAVYVVSLDPADSEPVTVKAQQYAVIRQGSETTVTPGRLGWTLEPMAPR